MNAEQERVLRTWLEARDPGAVPGRLRTAVRDVPSAVRPPLFPVVEEVRARFRWATTPLRLGVLAIVLLAIVGAIAAAALLLRTPFVPQGLIAYTSFNGGIRIVEADGSDDRALTAGGHEKSPRWSPDGRSLLFIRFIDAAPGSECAEQTSIVVRDLERGDERILATVPLVVTAEWSPSGSQVAFGGLGGPCELAGSGLIDVASGRVTASDAGAGGGFLVWTGDAITFLYSDHLSTVSVSELDGHATLQTVLTFDAAHVANPSPAGRYVALSGTPDDLLVPLEIVDLTDGTRVTLGPGSVGWWSPDGSSVAFVQPGVPALDPARSRDRLMLTVGGERQLRYLIDIVVRGGSPTRPLDMPLLHWTPDGRAIYWRDAVGAHVVDVATGQSIDLPRVLSFADDFRWQPPLDRTSVRKGLPPAILAGGD